MQVRVASVIPDIVFSHVGHNLLLALLLLCPALVQRKSLGPYIVSGYYYECSSVAAGSVVAAMSIVAARSLVEVSS